MEIDLSKLQSVAKSREGLQIVPHNDPDPDAIASALGIQYLFRQAWGLDVAIAYEGIIGRAENRALVQYLESPLVLMSDDRVGRPAILVDTQPGAGNNPYPDASQVVAVIDHHPLLPETAHAPIVDVRPELGSTASIVVGYLRQLDISIPTQLATGLFYGIKSDTLCLARGASAQDLEALLFVQSLVDEAALLRIERAQVSPQYFRAFHQALESTTVYNHVLFSYIGVMAYPDWAAEMADWFLRLDSIQWVVCAGIYEDTLYLSIRTRDLKGGAGRIARHVIGRDGFAGGHGLAAGGQLPLRGRSGADMAAQIRDRVLQRLKVDHDIVARKLL